MIFSYSYENGKGYFEKTGANTWGEFDYSTGKQSFSFTSIEEASSYILLYDASRGFYVKLTNNACLWGYDLNSIDKKVHDGSWSFPQYSQMIFSYSYENGKGYFEKTGTNTWGEFDYSTGNQSFSFTSIDEAVSYILLYDASRKIYVKLTRNECLWGYSLNAIDKKVHNGFWSYPSQ